MHYFKRVKLTKSLRIWLDKFPIFGGIENYTDVKLSARDQWVGLNAAPKTYYFSIQVPIGKNDYRTSSTSFEVPGQYPRGKYYWENYTAAEPHHGIGLTMINDRTGSFNRFTIDATYAYHLGLNHTTNLSAGFSAGITNVSLDKSKHDYFRVMLEGKLKTDEAVEIMIDEIAIKDGNDEFSSDFILLLKDYYLHF